MIAILGHNLASFSASLILQERISRHVCMKSSSPSWHKPLILTSGAYNTLKKHGLDLEAYALKQMEISAYRQFGTLEFDDPSALGYSISSQDCFTALQNIQGPPELVDEKTWNHIQQESTLNIFCDSNHLPDHDSQDHDGVNIMVFRGRVVRNCHMLLQRFIPEGIMAWIPSDTNTGTTIITSTTTTTISPSRVQELWGKRLSFTHLEAERQLQIPTYFRQPKNASSVFLGVCQLSMAPILARGFNLVIEQLHAISAGHTEQVQSLGNHMFQLTRNYQRLGKCGHLIGPGLHSISQQPSLMRMIKAWGKQQRMEKTR